MGWYFGTNFNDNIIGTAGTDYIFGGAGDDLITGGAGADSLSGGTGIDSLVYIGSGAGVTVDLTNGTAHGGDAEGDAFSGFENIIGSSYNDVLTGDGGANVLSGGAGNDYLYGGWGNDSLYGGSGGDWLMGGVGADHLDGGGGSDHVTYEAGFVGVTVNLLTGTASNGEAQGDTYVSIEHVNGSQGVDLLIGDLNGNTLAGEAGNDSLYGLAGNDGLIGGIGDDLLNGGAGTDYLNGEQGGDTYVFLAASESPANPYGAFIADTIVSFDDGGMWNDVINLATIDANETIGGDQAFFLDNGNGVTETGELLIITNFLEDEDDIPVTIFYADVTGDGVADFGVKFDFVINTLDASDFIL